ncbi:MAG TPA: exonuclease [Candidatus Avidesulfovibrio excrementigallinarum]|nr:exonuclease [Candidatus Avidesulfovibrio excrementigallinarum]
MNANTAGGASVPRPGVVVAIDFETADNGADSACAVGMARVEDGRVVDTLYQLLRPPRARILYTWVHGLTWAMLKDQPTFAQFWPAMAAFAGPSPVFVAHNARFDRNVLTTCRAAMGAIQDSPFLCTLKGARRYLNLPRNRLSDVCAYLNIALTHHHAGSDALGAAGIYLHLRAMGVSDEALRI